MICPESDASNDVHADNKENAVKQVHTWLFGRNNDGTLPVSNKYHHPHLPGGRSRTNRYPQVSFPHRSPVNKA